MTLKRLIAIGFACAIIGLTVGPAWAQEGVAPAEVHKPMLSVPETTFDFGYVPQGAKISHVYWLINTGEDTLFIQDIKPG
ncbi:MAG TPA: hypothetical protein VM118_08745 [Acidobacteriota bacterium]|nr:hypothetical protein [Acidobacteriota bacterium]